MFAFSVLDFVKTVFFSSFAVRFVHLVFRLWQQYERFFHICNGMDSSFFGFRPLASVKMCLNGVVLR